MKKSIALVILMYFGWIPHVFAWELTLHVMAKGRGDDLGRVEVKVDGQKIYTDSKGMVKLPSPVRKSLQLYRSGFEILELRPQDLATSGQMDVYMYPATPNGEEVVVTGIKRPEVSRKKVTIEEAVKVAPGGDPAQIPKALPGVQTTGFGSDIVVRGSAPAESAYYVDDWAVPYIFHRIGNISIFPDQLLSDIEFSSGGFGTQYGEATGGVLTLRTKSGVPERNSTEVRVNVPIYSSIYHERAIEDGKGKLAISARRSYIEKFLPIVLKNRNSQGADLTIVPYFGDLHLYYEKPREDGQIKILALHSYDGLKLAFPSAVADNESGKGSFNIKDTVSLLGLQWSKNLGNNWSLTTSPYLSDIDNKIDVLGNRIYVGALSLSLHAEAIKRFSGRNKLYLGSQLIHYWGRADVFVPRPDFSDPFFDFEEAPKVKTKVHQSINDLAIWTAFDIEMGDFLVTPGVRGFYSSRIERSDFDPRINARYKINADNQLKIAVGQYSKSPEFAQVSENFGNPHLRFIRSSHYVLGVETQWKPSWVTDIQGFYKETHKLVRSDPISNYSNNGQRITFGGEVFIRRNLTERFFGWFAYTWSRNLERDTSLETFRHSQYDQTHVLNIVGNYKLTSIWETGGRLVYHTGDTYTPVDGSVYNANLDKYQQRNNPETRLYSQRLPAYREANLYATRDYLFDTWKMSLRFGVEQLALGPNVSNIQYNYDYTKAESFKGLPLIPYIEIRGVL